MQIVARMGTIEEALWLQEQVPEFGIAGYTKVDYENRLQGCEYLILIAEVNGEAVGFKVGYDRFLDGEVFYSWMGGVLPEYRAKGIAKLLLQKMEIWCRIKGYKYLKFKTRNRNRAMMAFAIGQDFDIVDFEPKRDQSKSRIYFQKKL